MVDSHSSKSVSLRENSEMKKTIVALVLGFIAGYLTHRVISPPPTLERHWKIVHEFLAYADNPTAVNPNSPTGFVSVPAPAYIEPSLTILVLAGELNHADLVLSSVVRTKAVTRHWMVYCHEREDIIWSEGSPTHTRFPVDEPAPFHFNIWYLDSAEDDVQQLIEELKELGKLESSVGDSSPKSTPLRNLIQ